VAAATASAGVATEFFAASPARADTPPLSWSNLTPPADSPGNVSGVTAYDAATNQDVVYTGGPYGPTTWTWDGSTWTLQPSGADPSGQTLPLLAYDAATSQLILVEDGTWSWNGTAWTQVSPQAPTLSGDLTADNGAALAYDATTGQLILTMSDEAGVPVTPTETWNWNGSSWVELAPALSPPPRFNPGLSYFANDAALVMFGGYGAKGYLQDTWIWTGTTWGQLHPTTSPSPRTATSMADDSTTGRLVLFGGSGLNGGTAAQALADTWAFNGTTWSERASGATPGAVNTPSLSFDAATSQLVLFGGIGNSDRSDLEDTWTWNGSGWNDMTPLPTSPDGNVPTSMAFDTATNQMIAVTNGKTFAWASGTWTELSLTTHPPGFGSLAYDAATSQLIWFEQNASTAGPPSTWTWTGTTWTELTPTASPPVVDGVASLGYDPSTSQLVLVGSMTTGSGPTEQTWTWDGSTWTEQTPAGSPSLRSDAQVGFDPATGDLIVFGGFASVGSATDLLSDTWGWTGSTWTEFSPATSPPATADGTMAYDPTLGNLVLFGGTLQCSNNLCGNSQNATWEWSGTNWSQLSLPQNPVGRARAGFGWDPTTQQMLLLGGISNAASGIYAADTWVLGTNPIATPTITSVTIGNSLATVTWTPPALGPGVIVADYLVTAEPSGTTIEVAGTADSAQITGLTNGDSYVFTVQPTNQWGTYPTSPPSSPAVTPLGAPGAPTGVSVIAGDASATLEWTAPVPSLSEGPVTGYVINGAPEGPVYAPADATSVVVTGLTNGDGYILSVAAESAFGTGPPSTNQIVYPYSPLPAPTIVSVAPGDHSLTVSWSPGAVVSGDPVVGYTITTSYAGVVTVGPDVTSATITGLQNGTSYTVVVSADAADGLGEPSAQSSSVTPVGPPDAAEAVSAADINYEIVVQWVPNSLDLHGWATGFDIVVSSGGTEVASQVAGQYQTEAYFQVPTDADYSVTVTPFNSYGDGPPSTPPDVFVYGPLGAPTGVHAALDGADLMLTWTPPTNTGGQTITGYQISAASGVIDTVGATAVSAVVSGLTPGAKYSFTVAALSAEGTGASSTAVSATFPAVAPGTPVGVAAAAGIKDVTVSWSPPTSTGGDPISGYIIDVYACVPKSSPCVQKLIRAVGVTAATRQHTIGALANGALYFFTVAAKTKAGVGVPSAEVSATPVA
jgi:hypothetical protein